MGRAQSVGSVIVEGTCDTCGVEVKQTRSIAPQGICEYLEKKHPDNGCENPKFSQGHTRSPNR